MFKIKYILLKMNRSFIVKIFVFFVILFILDFGIGSLLEYYYFKQKSGYLARANYSIDQTTADLLIFGASTANHQYIPDIFEKRLHLTAYNVGRDGTSIIYHYALLKAILKRYTPKIIILDIRRELAAKSDGYDRLSMLFPYYKKHPEFYEMIKLKGQYENFKMVSRIYPFNSLIFAIFSGNTRQIDRGDSDVKGFIPLTRVWNEEIDTLRTPILNKLDPNKIRIFESFIKACIAAKIKLYIVISPNFFIMDYTDIADKKAREIAGKYNVTFLNYSQDSMFLTNAKYFADIHHLNQSGSTLLSNRLANKITEDEKYDYLKHNAQY